jgi:hypothetical protein
MEARSRTGTTPTRVRELVHRDAGARQVALQRPVYLLARLDGNDIGGVIVGSADRVGSEPNDAGGAESAARYGEGGDLYRSGQPDSIYDAVMQHRDDDVIPMVIVDHQQYLASCRSGVGGCFMPGAADRGKQQKTEELQA